MRMVDLEMDYKAAKAAFLARRHHIMYKMLDAGRMHGPVSAAPEIIKDIIWHLVYAESN